MAAVAMEPNSLLLAREKMMTVRFPRQKVENTWHTLPCGFLKTLDSGIGVIQLRGPHHRQLTDAMFSRLKGERSHRIAFGVFAV